MNRVLSTVLISVALVSAPVFAHDDKPKPRAEAGKDADHKKGDHEKGDHEKGDHKKGDHKKDDHKKGDHKAKGDDHDKKH